MVKPIPAIWRIDVEPDDFQPGKDSPPWTGFVAMSELVERLRPQLSAQSGTFLHRRWFLRDDPDIGRCYGRADYVFDNCRALIDRIRCRDDSFGIRVHFY